MGKGEVSFLLMLWIFILHERKKENYLKEQERRRKRRAIHPVLLLHGSTVWFGLEQEDCQLSISKHFGLIYPCQLPPLSVYSLDSFLFQLVLSSNPNQNHSIHSHQDLTLPSFAPITKSHVKMQSFLFSLQNLFTCE